MVIKDEDISVSMSTKVSLILVVSGVFLVACIFIVQNTLKPSEKDGLNSESTKTVTMTATFTGSPEIETLVTREDPTETSTPTISPTITHTPQPTSTGTPIPTYTSTPTHTPTSTPMHTPTSTTTLTPFPTLLPLITVPTLPPNTNCHPDHQYISQPVDLERLGEGREFLNILGTANWAPGIDKYVIGIIKPDRSYQSLYEVSVPVKSGTLLEWEFEKITRKSGGGWYILRLLVIYEGNHIQLGVENQGCYVRVYLPPPY